MPVHVEELTTEVTVLDGDLPLTAAQVERLVELVAARLEQRHRDARRREEAVTPRRHVAPPFGIDGR